jgi:hypothetical protein
MSLIRIEKPTRKELASLVDEIGTRAVLFLQLVNKGELVRRD